MSTHSRGTAEFSAHTGSREAPQSAPQRASGSPDSDSFAALLHAYRSSGGTARSDDLAQLFEQHMRGNYVDLAKLLAAREIWGFRWRQNLWVPMFQFNAYDLSVKPAARDVLAELGSSFEGWRLASWFVGAHAWLNGRRPVDVLDHDSAEVLDAARHEGGGPRRR